MAEGISGGPLDLRLLVTGRRPERAPREQKEGVTEARGAHLLATRGIRRFSITKLSGTARLEPAIPSCDSNSFLLPVPLPLLALRRNRRKIIGSAVSPENTISLCVFHFSFCIFHRTKDEARGTRIETRISSVKVFLMVVRVFSSFFLTRV